MSATPKASWPAVRALLHSVYDQPDAKAVDAQYDRVLETLNEKLPKVAEHLENARTDLTAFPRRASCRPARASVPPAQGCAASSSS